MKEKLIKAIPLISVLIVLLLMCFGAFMAGYNIGKKKGKKVVDKATVEVKTKADKKVNPQPARVSNIKTIKVAVKVKDIAPQEPDNIPNGEITVFKPGSLLTDTLDDTPPDSYQAEVPIIQKEYRDSNYTAYISGFMPQLDSIEVKSQIITYTKTVTKYRRWNVGITGGYGYGLLSQRLEPFIGIGLTYNVFK